MRELSRRAFVSGSGAAAFFLPGLASAQPNYGAAELVILGGNFYSMDPALGRIEALAVSGDRILAVGSKSDIQGLVKKGTRVIDATGLTVTPGFIDAHSHPLSANEAVSERVDFRQIPKIQDALRARAAKTPPGKWVFGHMYDDTKLEGGRPLTRQDLDQVSTTHPIYVLHRGGHTAVVNSKAFEQVGLTTASTDPEGGRYFRDANGFTGLIAEKALEVFAAAGGRPSPSRRETQEGARIATKRMAAAGLTSTTDADGGMTELFGYSDAYAAGELSCRVCFMPATFIEQGRSKSAYEHLKETGQRSGQGDAMLRIGAVKRYVDGSVSERTMRMSTPYAGRPNDFGILTATQAELDAAVDDAVASGFRIGVHANGDVAIGMVLSSYERVLKGWKGPNPRFRIEHCTLVNPQLLERIKKTGAVPTPFYTYVYFHDEKWPQYGDEKLGSMFAHRWFLDYGIPVAPASDYIAGPYEPLLALQSLSTRKGSGGKVWGAAQKVTVAEAMKICTVHGAHASFEEGLKGSLTPGKLADIVMLERDPHTVDPDSIKDIKVVRTLLGGKLVHEA